jgi:hypothetical protein
MKFLTHLSTATYVWFFMVNVVIIKKKCRRLFFIVRYFVRSHLFFKMLLLFISFILTTLEKACTLFRCPPPCTVPSKPLPYLHSSLGVVEQI